MGSRKKIVRKDFVRLARQQLWIDLGRALDAYEKRVYGDLALHAKRKSFPVTDPELDAPDGAVVDGFERVGDRWHPTRDPEPEVREGDITDPAALLPPESKKRSRGARKSSPVSEHIRGESEPERERERVEAFSRSMGQARAEMNLGLPKSEAGLGTSEEKVLVLIVQSAGGMTPAQIAIQITLKKRTIQNILTSLKSQRFIIKDANHGKFRATEEGKTAVKGRYVEIKKGAILEKLSESERKVLFAIASKKEGVTLSAISVMVPGITKRTKQNIITALKTRELIEKNEDRFMLTAYAREELKGKLAKPLTGKKLREHLAETLPDTQAIVLDVIHTSDSGAMLLSEIAHTLNGRCTLRTVQNIMTALKAQELVSKRDDGRFELAASLRG